MRKVIEEHICPSNGTVIRRHKDRYGEDSAPNAAAMFGCGPRYKSSRVTQHQFETWEGWGGDVDHYYVVEDMLKLHPGQIMELYDFIHDYPCTRLDGVDSLGNHKQDVEVYVGKLGEWFDSNGQTLGETVKLVVSERGEDELDGMGAIVAEE